MTRHDNHSHSRHQSTDPDVAPSEHIGGSTSSGGHGPGGHDKHEGHSPEMFRDRLWVSLIVTVPILYFSDQIQEWFGFASVTFSGMAWVIPVLASFLYLYAGSVFLKGGLAELKARQPGMMTLISMAISVAYGYSVAVTFGLDGDPFYWELATLLVVMLLGHWVEMRSVQSASRALDHLAAMVPDTAHRIEADGSIVDVPVADLNDGDRFMVRPGEQVAVDGEVVEGASSMNEAFLTGESRPVSKTSGDEIVAGAVNGEGALIAVITRTGDATTLSQIMRLVEEAQASRSRFQVLADRAAFWLTIIAIGVSVPTLIAWLTFGSSGATFAVSRAVTVLVIACPHALGLAIPLVNMNATSISARNGILVRNREAFERGRGLTFVAFDKTGTLTEGRFALSAITVSGLSETEAIGAAAALERASEHPLAVAITEAAGERAIDVPQGLDVTAIPGQGLMGRVDGRMLRVGRPQWVRELGVAMPGPLEEALREADRRGESAIVMMDDHRALAVIGLADRVRESARDAVRGLQAIGVVPIMITGDAEAVARTVAEDLGIDRYYARILPQDKARIIREIKEAGPVGFVGDGINDAPALLEADLGVAIGAGTNVAIESADLVLVDDDPADVVRAIRLSKAASRKMRQNLAWATGYNTIAIPLAAGVAAPAGILLSPAVGALLMSLSTVMVAFNAMLLRRIDIS